MYGIDIGREQIFVTPISAASGYVLYIYAARILIVTDKVNEPYPRCKLHSVSQIGVAVPGFNCPCGVRKSARVES